MIPREPYKGRILKASKPDKKGFWWQFYCRGDVLYGECRYLDNRGMMHVVQRTKPEMEKAVIELGIEFSKSKAWIEAFWMLKYQNKI